MRKRRTARRRIRGGGLIKMEAESLLRELPFLKGKLDSITDAGGQIDYPKLAAYLTANKSSFEDGGRLQHGSFTKKAGGKVDRLLLIDVRKVIGTNGENVGNNSVAYGFDYNRLLTKNIQAGMYKHSMHVEYNIYFKYTEDSLTEVQIKKQIDRHGNGTTRYREFAETVYPPA